MEVDTDARELTVVYNYSSLQRKLYMSKETGNYYSLTLDYWSLSRPIPMIQVLSTILYGDVQLEHVTLYYVEYHTPVQESDR